MSPESLRSQGVHGSGGRSYSAAEYAAVVSALRSLGAGEAITVAALSERTGVSGRTVREIVSAADGVDFLIGESGREGYRLARTRGEAAVHSAKLASQATRMYERGRRRLAYAWRLPEDD